MRILLIKSMQILGQIGKFTHSVHPLGLCYIASYLEKNGHEVKIIDYDVEPFNKTLLIEEIKSYKPNLIGLSCMTCAIKKGNYIANTIKNKFNIPIVVGGSHPTALPYDTLDEFKSFDIITHGEAEKTILEICNNLENGETLENISGIGYRTNGKITINPPRSFIENLDELPFPARQLLKLDKYTANTTLGMVSKNSTHLITSRGCPYNCTFCSASLNMGKKLRVRSVKNVIKEIKECIEKYNMDYFRTHDSTFTIDRERTIKFCDEIGKLGVVWSCDTRVDKVDRELLQIMYNSGCKKISFGIESGSPRILKLIKKILHYSKLEMRLNGHMR